MSTVPKEFLDRPIVGQTLPHFPRVDRVGYIIPRVDLVFENVTEDMEKIKITPEKVTEDAKKVNSMDSKMIILLKDEKDTNTVCDPITV